LKKISFLTEFLNANLRKLTLRPSTTMNRYTFTGREKSRRTRKKDSPEKPAHKKSSKLQNIIFRVKIMKGLTSTKEKN